MTRKQTGDGDWKSIPGGGNGVLEEGQGGLVVARWRRRWGGSRSRWYWSERTQLRLQGLVVLKLILEGWTRLPGGSDCCRGVTAGKQAMQVELPQ